MINIQYGQWWEVLQRNIKNWLDGTTVEVRGRVAVLWKVIGGSPLQWEGVCAEAWRKCETPEESGLKARVCLVCLRNNKDARVVDRQWARGRRRKLDLKGIANIFSHSTVGLRILLIVSFGAKKFLSLRRSQLSVFAFVACAFGVTSKKSLTNSMSWRFPLCFLLGVLWFQVLHLGL